VGVEIQAPACREWAITEQKVSPSVRYARNDAGTLGAGRPRRERTAQDLQQVSLNLLPADGARKDARLPRMPAFDQVDQPKRFAVESGELGVVAFAEHVGYQTADSDLLDRLLLPGKAANIDPSRGRLNSAEQRPTQEVFRRQSWRAISPNAGITPRV
jgi:hypothetical protein